MDIDLNTKLGKDYVALLDGLKLGEALQLDSLAPGLSEENTYAILKAIKDNGAKFEFTLFWYDIPLGSTSIHRKGDKLICGVKL